MESNEQLTFESMIMRKIFCVLFLFYTSVLATDYSPGTVGFQFLRSQVGARPAGLSGAFLAIPGDVHNIHYNPAGLTHLPKRTASFTYLNHVLDFNSGFFGFVKPKLGIGSFGLGVLYMDYGTFTRTTIEGQETGSFGANSVSLTTSYAVNVLSNISFGLSGKYIRANIDNFSADAVAMDAAVLYSFPEQQLHFAAGVFNAGKSITAFVTHKDKLPFNFRVGFSKRLAHLPLLISFNVYKYVEEDWHGAVGGEFMLSEHLLLRLGYDHLGREMQVDSSRDRFAGASIGFGLLLQSFLVDYSLTSYGEIGMLNRFSISGSF